MNPALLFKLRDDLVIAPSETNDDAIDEVPQKYMIKSPASGEIFELGKEEFFLANCLDGQASLNDIIQRFERAFDLVISEDYLRQFIQQIGEFGLLEALAPLPPPYPEMRSDAVPARERFSAGEPGLTQHSSKSSSSVLVQDKKRGIADAAESDRNSEHPRVSLSAAAKEPVVQPKIKPKKEDYWHWFDPTALLKFLDLLFSPFRPLMGVVVGLMLPAVLVAVTIFFKNQTLLWADIEQLKTPTSYLGSLLFHLLTINLLSRLALGTVCVHYGGEVKEFGLRLRFGIIPRFHIDLRCLNRFDRHAKLWCYGTSLLLRIGLFVLGMFAWIGFRGSGTELTMWAISLAQAGFIGFIIVSAPVGLSHGYRWFTTLMRLPTNLLPRSLLVFSSTIRGRPLPGTISQRDRGLLCFYGFFLLTCWIFITIKLTASIASGLASTFPNIFGQATPFLLGTLATLLFFRWVWTAILKGRVQPDREPIRESFDRSSEPSPVLANTAHPWEIHHSSAINPWLKRFKKGLWLIFCAVLGLILMMPYPYRPGGAVQLLPPQQQLVQVPTAGKVVDVYVSGANGQWLKSGQAVAKMTSTDLQNEQATLQAQVSEQQAEVQKQKSILGKVESEPRQEEVEVARRQIAVAQQSVLEASKQREEAQANSAIAQQKIQSAEVQLPYKLTQIDRFQQLYDEGAYTLQGVEEAQAQAEVTKAEIEEARKALQYADKKAETAAETLAIQERQLESAQAELALLQSDALPADVDTATQEINAAQARLQALQQNMQAMRRLSFRAWRL